MSSAGVEGDTHDVEHRHHCTREGAAGPVSLLSSVPADHWVQYSTPPTSSQFQAFLSATIPGLFLTRREGEWFFNRSITE
jgi:hypothetical protein